MSSRPPSMAMNSSIKNSRLLITGTLLHHKHQLRDFFNRYDWLTLVEIGYTGGRDGFDV
jgi:hypothetical protein